MGATIARVLVSIAIFCLPFFIFVGLNDSADSALMLLIPAIGAVPAVIAILVLFLPIEKALDAAAKSYLKNIIVPAAGGLIIFIFLVVVSATSGKPNLILERASIEGVNFWGPLLLWSALGAFWGLIWRLTEWLVKKIGLINVE